MSEKAIAKQPPKPKLRKLDWDGSVRNKHSQLTKATIWYNTGSPQIRELSKKGSRGS